MKRAFTLSILLATALVGLAFGALGCEKHNAETPIKQVLAASERLQSGLVLLAQERGFFKDEGVEVALVSPTSGTQCLALVDQGKADFGTVADVGFFRNQMASPTLRIVASIASFSHIDIISRKDRDISVPADLEGKRIGLPITTGALYTLEAFLRLNGIAPAEVEMVDFPPPELPHALAGGRVDAICIWGKFGWKAKQYFGSEAVSWPAQNTQNYNWMLVMDTPKDKNSEAARRVLKALLRAQEFALDHPDEAKAFLAERLGYSNEYMGHYWERTRLGVSLEQSLVLALEDISRWYRSREGKTDETPNVLEYMEPGPLEAVDAAAVTFYR